MAPTRHEVLAITTLSWHLSPPQYWFWMITCARLMMIKLYAVDRLEIDARVVLRLTIGAALKSVSLYVARSVK